MRLKSKKQKELVLNNQKLVYHLVNKMQGIDYHEKEEFYSVGMVGLIKAAITFDESKNIKFTTYASKCIINEINMQFRRNKGHSKDISIETCISQETEITLAEVIPDPKRKFTELIEEKEVFIQFIHFILNSLKPRDRLIMLYQISDMNQRKIAKELNTSQSYVSRLIKKLGKEVKKNYLTTKQHFKEGFSMTIKGNSYQISFSTKETEDFNAILANYLQNSTTLETLPDFVISRNKERIIVLVPAKPESFYFIAQLIKEIDDYKLTYTSSQTQCSDSYPIKNEKAKEDDTHREESEANETGEEQVRSCTKDQNETEVSQSVKEEKIKNDTESVRDEEISLVRESQLQQVRKYFLGLESFTTKELKEKFPEAKIGNAIHFSKEKGEIISICRGVYKVVKKN